MGMLYWLSARPASEFLLVSKGRENLRSLLVQNISVFLVVCGNDRTRIELH
jgi:hypothetical protein